MSVVVVMTPFAETLWACFPSPGSTLDDVQSVKVPQPTIPHCDVCCTGCRRQFHRQPESACICGNRNMNRMQLATLLVLIVGFSESEAFVSVATRNSATTAAATDRLPSSPLRATEEKAAPLISGADLEVMLTEWDTPLVVDAYATWYALSCVFLPTYTLSHYLKVELADTFCATHTAICARTRR